MYRMRIGRRRISIEPDVHDRHIAGNVRQIAGAVTPVALDIVAESDIDNDSTRAPVQSHLEDLLRVETDAEDEEALSLADFDDEQWVSIQSLLIETGGREAARVV
jgi:hypothetical protein